MLDYANEKFQKNVNTKKCRKIKVTLFSLECSILLGEVLNSHMPFPFLPTLLRFFGRVMHFCKSLEAIFINAYCKYLLKKNYVVYWQVLENA
jgi:hypothetical protein